MSRVVCFIASRPQDLHQSTVDSLMRQTVSPDMVVFATKTVNKPAINMRVATVLNEAFQQVRIGQFDYILRLDGDTVLSSNFLEKNLKLDMDLVGSAGCAQLIRIRPFLELMNGQLNETSDDTYIGLKFRRHGKKVAGYAVKPIHSSTTHHPMNDYVNRGVQLYKLGYEPVHVVQQCLFKRGAYSLKDLATVLTYFAHFFRRTKKLDIATWTWRYQVKRLVK